MSPLRLMFGQASPAGERARLTMLIFHRVLPEFDPIFPEEMHARRFDAVCGWLKRWFQVLPLDEAARRQREGSLPARACCITFDDGYADNLHVAAPILQKHGLNASFFIATGFLDGGRMWNDTLIEAVRKSPLEDLQLDELGDYALGAGDASRRRAIIDALIGKIKYLPVAERLALTERVARQAQVEPARDLMMTSAELRALRATGMLIGAHTVSHPILARLDAAEARREIAEGRDFLERLLGERIGLFAYPNGKPGTDYLPEHVQIVRELGFDAAVSTAWGAARRGSDDFQLPRFTPWDESSWRFGLRLLGNLARA